MSALIQRRDWFQRLHQRMKATGWDEGDPIMHAVLNAHAATHKLAKLLDVDPPNTKPDWMKHIGPG